MAELHKLLEILYEILVLCQLQRRVVSIRCEKVSYTWRIQATKHMLLSQEFQRC